LEELRRARQELSPSNTFIPQRSSKLKGLEMTQQNLCLSNPNLPNNPLIYASQAFLNMTGYSLYEILGRNCHFLQGPETDPHHIHRIQMAIQEGIVCLVNYNADGTKFYNQCFIAAFRDNKDRIKKIESKYISACLATVHWNDSLHEEGSKLTWKSDMSIELSSPKIISTTMTVPKQRHSSSDLKKMVPPLSRDAKTTRDVSFQSLKISDKSLHGAEKVKQKKTRFIFQCINDILNFDTQGI
jgi:PAS domain